jgi:putative membrane protein
MDIAVRYIHFLSIFLLCGSILMENALLRKEMRRGDISRLALIDSLLGMSAITVLSSGLLLWFQFGKGFAFYAGNPVFHAKLTAFLIGALLSIYPTVYFIRQRKGDPEERISVPSRVGLFIKLELVVILCIPLLAVTMAKGIGVR